MPDWNKIEDKERSKLESKLDRLGSGFWKLTYHAKRLGKLGVMLYAINAGVQTMNLVSSEAYKSRERLARNGYEIAQELRTDSTFHRLVGSYIETKATLNPQFRGNVDEFKRDLTTAFETQDEFLGRVEKIYNPFAYIN